MGLWDRNSSLRLQLRHQRRRSGQDPLARFTQPVRGFRLVLDEGSALCPCERNAQTLGILEGQGTKHGDRRRDASHSPRKSHAGRISQHSEHGKAVAELLRLAGFEPLNLNYKNFGQALAEFTLSPFADFTPRSFATLATVRSGANERPRGDSKKANRVRNGTVGEGFSATQFGSLPRRGCTLPSL